MRSARCAVQAHLWLTRAGGQQLRMTAGAEEAVHQAPGGGASQARSDLPAPNQLPAPGSRQASKQAARSEAQSSRLCFLGSSSPSLLLPSLCPPPSRFLSFFSFFLSCAGRVREHASVRRGHL